jgi:hypothetical protein
MTKEKHNSFEKGIELFSRKIQWLVNNDKIKDKMLAEYNKILELIISGYNQLESELAHVNEEMFQKNHDYKVLYEDTQELVYLCELYDVNPNLIFQISLDTFKYYLNHRNKLPKDAFTLVEASFFIESIKQTDHAIRSLRLNTLPYFILLPEKTKEINARIAYLELLKINLQDQLNSLK